MTRYFPFYYRDGQRVPIFVIPAADPEDIPALHLKIESSWWLVQSGTPIENHRELDRLRFNLRDDIKGWCYANLTEFPDLVNFHAQIDAKAIMAFCLRFKSDRDYVLFKLFWC